MKIDRKIYNIYMYRYMNFAYGVQKMLCKNSKDLKIL